LFEYYQQYTIDINGTPTTQSLFTADNTQTIISLYNGYSSGSQSGPVNLNGTYYEGVLSDWNSHVTALAQVSAATQTFASDCGAAGNTALFLTRVENFDPSSVTQSLHKEKIKLIAMRYLGNAPELKAEAAKLNTLVKQNSKGKVKGISPASVALLTSQQMLSAVPLTTELEGYYNFMLLPVIRTNNTEDALTVPMYQVETGEGLSTFYQSSTAEAGVSMYSKLENYAAVCVPGQARDANDYYTRITEMLQSESHAGMIGSLLGGLVKGIIPGCDGVVDTVAALCPF